jgi:uncharacterized protein YutD
MKIHPTDSKKQSLLREIEQLENYIAEYRSQTGCIYWITIFSDRTVLGNLYKHLKGLRAEYDSYD